MPSKNFNAVVKVDGEVGASLKNSFGTVKKGVKGLGDQLRTINATQDKIKAFDVAKLRQQKSALRESERKLEDLKTEMKSTNKPSRQLTQQFERQKKAVQKHREAVDKNRERLKGMRTELRKAGINTKKLSSEQDRLQRELEQTADKMKKIDRAKNALSSMGGTLRKVGFGITAVTGAATGAGAALFGLTKSVGIFGDSTAKIARTIDISAQSLQELRFVAERNGVSMETFDSSMKKFARTIGDAKNGTGTLNTLLARMDPELLSLLNSTTDTEEAFNIMIEAINNVEDPMETASLAAAAFGRSGIELVNMIKSGPKEIDNLREEARKLGFVLGKEALDNSEDFQDRLLDLNLAFTGVKNTIGSALLPIMTKLFIRIKDFVLSHGEQMKAFALELADRIQSSIPMMINFGKVFIGIGSAVDTAVQFIGGWKNLLAIATGFLAAKGIIAFIGFAKSIGTVATAVKALTLVMAANPIGAIVTAVTVGAALIIANWDTVKSFFLGLWDTIKNTFTSFPAFLKTVFSFSPLGLVVRAFKPAFDWLENRFGFIKDAFSGIRSFFGGDEEASTPGSGLANAKRADINTAPLKSSRSTSVSNQVQITVAPTEGQNAEQIAEEVMRRFNDQQQALATGALYDG